MAIPLLQTKLYAPQVRPGLVARPRLIERLDAGLHRKLTLISAPAGCGKTTLVSAWISHFGLGIADSGLETTSASAIGNRQSAIRNRVAWLSLDEDDNDLPRFLTYLIAALQTTGADVGKGMWNALGSPQPPPAQVVLTTLINEIAALPERTILVLDDYHLIQDQSIHDALAFLLQHQPPQMHLVVATREDPPLPLARLRARGQLTELRAADLRFSASEAAEFLNQTMGLDLAQKDITTLERRTEGWIAGLQMAALSMQGHEDLAGFIQSFTGSHRFVLDYLIEEVLERQPEDIQTFLLQTSILDRLCGSLCDAVRFGDGTSEQRDGQSILEMLELANLFIVPLDEERCWYRYHHLFADLLRQRLRQTQRDWEPTLHVRASEWYEQNGFVDHAIEHALSASEFNRASQLVEEHADTIWGSGAHGKLQRWLARLPDERLCAKPQLCIYHAWFLFSTGQEKEAQRLLEIVDRSLDASSRRAAETRLQGRLGAMRATMEIWWKDLPRVIEHASQGLECLSRDDPWRGMAAVALGDAYYFQGDMAAAYRARLELAASCKPADDLFLFMIAHLKVATSLRELGQLQQTIEICRQQVAFARENGLSQTIFVGWAMALWGISLAERNELDQALELATKSVELTRGGDLSFFGFCSIVLAEVLFHSGDFAGAERVLQEIETIARKGYLPLHIMESVAAWKARTWLAQDRLETASQWLKERELDVNGELTSLPDRVNVVLARILLAQGQLEKATGLLDRLFETAEWGGHTSRQIEVLVLRARILQAKGHTAQAVNALERALTLAEPGGYIRIFVEEGPPMARMLYDALSQGIVPDYVRRLLAAFPTVEPEQAQGPETQAANAELIEPLSDREIEVLQFVAQGLSNPEIAARLFLSLNTVKVHTRNIYGKLGVHNRTQAAARAKALGILAST